MISSGICQCRRASAVASGPAEVLLTTGDTASVNPLPSPARWLQNGHAAGQPSARMVWGTATGAREGERLLVAMPPTPSAPVSRAMWGPRQPLRMHDQTSDDSLVIRVVDSCRRWSYGPSCQWFS